jgi:hypothetical protein
MMNRRGLLILAVPLVAGLTLAGLALLRPASGPSPLPSRKESAVPLPAPVARTTSPAAPRIQAVASKPAPDDVLAKATDDARVQSTYQNFRTAIATGNLALQDALRPVVLKDRGVAIRLAERDMADAPSELDRDIARKTLEALRR